MWPPPGQDPFNPCMGMPTTGVYNPMQTAPGMMGTTYIGGQPGMQSGWSPGQMYPSSFRGKEEYDKTFPQPMGTQMRTQQVADQAMRQSFESMRSGVSHQSEQLLLHEQHRHMRKHSPLETTDHMSRVMLWSGGALIAICALGLLICAVETTNDDRFVTFSNLSSAAGYVSFSSLMLVYALLSVAAVGCSVMAFWVGWKETRILMRTLVVSALVLGFILLVLALVLFLCITQARPDVVRVANLVCQDVNVWNCVAGSSEVAAAEKATRRLLQAGALVDGQVSLARRWVSSLVTTSWKLSAVLQQLAECAFEGAPVCGGASAAALLQRLLAWRPGRSRAPDPWESAEAFVEGLRSEAGGRNATASARRLTVAAAAMRYTQSLDSSQVNLDNVTGKWTNEVCQKISLLCVPPPEFNPATACVCRQMWDWSNAEYEETPGANTLRRLQSGSSSNSSNPSGEEPALPRNSSSGSSQPAGASSASSKEQSEDGGSASTPAPGPEAPSNVAVAGIGPWEETKGEYCNSWDRNSGSEERWCFVAASQECHSEMRQEVTCQSTGKPCYKSGGPCTNEVDSRSLYVEEGLKEMHWPLLWASVLGVTLALTGVCGLVAHQMNERERRKKAHAWAREDAAEAMERIEAAGEVHKSLDQIFEDAQREAVRKLKDSTPQDVKFQLYGFFMQAKEGDVRGDAPSFLNFKERRKWDSWAAHKGMPREEAIMKYSQCVKLID